MVRGILHRMDILHVEHQIHVQLVDDVVRRVMDDHVLLIVLILLVHVAHIRGHQHVMMEAGVVLHIVIQVVVSLLLDISVKLYQHQKTLTEVIVINH